MPHPQVLLGFICILTKIVSSEIFHNGNSSVTVQSVTSYLTESLNFELNVAGTLSTCIPFVYSPSISFSLTQSC